jgi:hypothetical protein
MMWWVRFCDPDGRDAAGYGRQDACRYRSVTVAGCARVGPDEKVEQEKVGVSAPNLANQSSCAREGIVEMAFTATRETGFTKIKVIGTRCCVSG